MKTIHALLQNSIDYAGLFQPANLDMQSAVRNYAKYRTSENAWMLGRFVLPVGSLDEFISVFNDVCCDELGSPWLLSVTGVGDADEIARCISGFHEGAVYLDTLECKLDDAKQVRNLIAGVPSGLVTYIEFPMQKATGMIPELKEVGVRAKLRAGGVTPQSFPSTRDLARFITLCAREKIAFKATAGLHHPLRSKQRVEDKADSETVMMHGFINLFTATTASYFGAAEDEVQSILEEKSSEAFLWSDDKLVIGRRQLSVEQMNEARKNFILSFGSCSFADPVHDLRQLGWL